MNKQGTFGSIELGFKRHLTALAALPKQAELSTTQGVSEHKDVATPTSDAEVKDILPNAGQPGTATPDLGTSRGVDAKEKLPDQMDPTPEEKERKEVSPETKLAADNISVIQNRLASGLIKAAEMLGTSKKAFEHLNEKPNTTAPGEAPPGFSAPGIPSVDAPASKEEMEKGQIGHGATNADTGTPSTESTQTVTETEISSNPDRTGKVEQGTKEETVKMGQLDLEDLRTKVASYVQYHNAGHAIGQKLATFLNAPAAPETPVQFSIEQQIEQKTAEWKAAGYNDEQISQAIVQMAQADAQMMKQANDARNAEVAVAVAGGKALLGFGLENGILTQKQAEDLMAAAGIAPEPVEIIGAQIRQKVASCREHGMADNAILAYLRKAAAHDAEAAALQGQGAPAPEEIQQAIHSLIMELHQLVQAGQLTEDQALDMLRQEGLPVDQMLAGAGADPVAGGGAGAPPVDPGAGGALPPDAGAGAPPDAGAGAPPIDPGGGAAAALGGALDPSAGGGAPPDAGTGAPTPPDAGAAVPPAGAETTPPPDAGAGLDAGSPVPPPADGGDKKPESKPEGKKEKGEDKKEEKSEDKEESKEKEAAFVKNLVTKGIITQKQADDISSIAGDSTGAAPEAPAGLDPSQQQDPGAGGAAPSAEELAQEVQALVASGKLPPEVAQQIMQLLSGGGDAGAGAPPDGGAGAPPAPAPGPTAGM